MKAILFLTTVFLMVGCASKMGAPEKSEHLIGHWMDTSSLNLQIVEFTSNKQFQGSRLGLKGFSESCESRQWHVEFSEKYNKDLLWVGRERFALSFEGQDNFIVMPYASKNKKHARIYYRSPFSSKRLNEIEKQIASHARTGNVEGLKALVALSDLPAYRLFLQKKSDWPIYYAAISGQWAASEYLLKATADINHFDAEVIQLFIQEKRHKAILQLLELGMDPQREFNTIDRQGVNLLYLAAREADFDLMKLLLNKGVNINHLTKEGMTIYDDVASCNRLCPKASRRVNEIQGFLKRHDPKRSS